MCSPRPFSAIARLRQTLTLLPAPSPNFPTLVPPQPIIIHHSLSCMIEYARLDKHHHVYQFLAKASSDWLFVTLHSHRHPFTCLRSLLLYDSYAHIRQNGIIPVCVILFCCISNADTCVVRCNGKPNPLFRHPKDQVLIAFSRLQRRR